VENLRLRELYQVFPMPAASTSEGRAAARLMRRIFILSISILRRRGTTATASIYPFWGRFK
jgi:hypothetical protein